ncbi:MAG: ABC transporter permease, partial [Vicinamibacteria bacterium]
MLNDLRLSLRLLTRRPALTAAAVLSLALGIGANTAIFAVVHGVVLRPLAFETPDDLAVVWETSPETRARWVAPANFVDWRRELTSFSSLTAFDDFTPALTGRGEAERLRALGVSGNYFATLGVDAAVGRPLTASDDEPDATPVAVLTDGLWTRLFGASPAVLGETLMLDGRPHTIVGVMPASFAPPLHAAIDVFVNGDRGIPRSFPFPGDLSAVRDSHILTVVGRLAPGATRDAAQAELDALMARLAEQYPDTNDGLGAEVVSLHEAVVGDVRPTVLLLQLAAGLMLLIACANVAHLLLGQAMGRRTEMATRVALGAGRFRLVRQLLAETLVMAVPGGLLGLIAASWGLDAIVALAPAGLPRVQDVGISGEVFAFTAAVTMVAALAFGVGPAWHLARLGAGAAGSGGQRVSGGRTARGWQRAMVVAELAVAQVLLVGAALLLVSFAEAQRVELGYVPEGRLAADLTLAPTRYLRPLSGDEDSFRVDTTPKLQFIDRVMSTMEAVPGVRAAAAAFTAPMAGTVNRGVRREDVAHDSLATGTAADFQIVTPRYFEALGVPLRQGRGFTEADRAGASLVAIVNEAFARAHFPGEDPLGRRIVFGGDRTHEIVGVVGDTRYRGVEQPPDPTFYVPMAQNDERWPFLSFTVWTDGDAASLGPTLRQAIHAADHDQAIARIRTYDEALASSLAPRRFNTLLAGVFAALALLLAAVGAYGVMALSVAARTRELGVRAALGASTARLLRHVCGEGAALTAAALVLGTTGGVA